MELWSNDGMVLTEEFELLGEKTFLSVGVRWLDG
jgi:hypothetical protein